MGHSSSKNYLMKNINRKIRDRLLCTKLNNFPLSNATFNYVNYADTRMILRESLEYIFLKR